MLRGSITALVTPFADGAVDEKAFAAFVDWQIREGSHGLVPVGTTGESPTLSHDEHRRVIEICVETADHRVPVIAGAGSNATSEAIHLAKAAKAAGADAMLSVAPYYNKPNQDGMYAHFKAIHDEVDLPIVLYNVPGRTIADISPETMGRLAHLPRVIGVKDATGDMSRVSRHRALGGADFIQLSGDDPSAVGFYAHGGKGCISVTANVAPALCAQLQNALAQGAFDTAREIDDKLAPLHRALFLEPSPAPTKYAASVLGLCTDDVRLPILTCSDGVKAQIRDAMKHAGLL